jgi:hypothetical protein
LKDGRIQRACLVFERWHCVRHAGSTPPVCTDDHAMCVTACPYALRRKR